MNIKREQTPKYAYVSLLLFCETFCFKLLKDRTIPVVIKVIKKKKQIS